MLVVGGGESEKKGVYHEGHDGALRKTWARRRARRDSKFLDSLDGVKSAQKEDGCKP